MGDVGDVISAYDMMIPSAFEPHGVYVGAQAIRAVAFHPSGESFLIGTNAKDLLYCSTSTLEEDADKVASRQGERVGDIEVLQQRVEHHFGSIYAVAWDARGKVCATGSNDKIVRVMPLSSAGDLPTADTQALVGHTGTVRALDFGQQGSLLATGGAGDCALRLWDVGSSVCISTLQGHTGHVYSLRLAQDGVTMASGGYDGTVRLWDLRSPNPASCKVIQVGQKVSSVAINPNSSLVAVGYADASKDGHYVGMLDIRAEGIVSEYNSHTEECRSLDFSPGGRWLLTGGSDNLVTIVDVQRHVVASTFKRHADKVTAVRWHPTTPAFLSSSADRSALLWGSTD